MRLDKFLKNSRIIKRRTVAKKAAEDERVLINGKIAKPSSEVSEGDIIEIKFASSILKVSVLNLDENTKKSNAQEMYRVIEHE
ncbi:MAG: RNA-binding S4 domain-containing protein [Peptoniphilaceae bacterium]|nr:RNA-binding S4 domain-containing protein [Peptoniphilaceae bacterium]MDD7383348.1 RNA-binding S4 domain-containing protein [Peptoniphilaceae bacterium]MDY3738281.1 RNA-binding S4 domain-containing protein [Peptoniphilaceae bacterium]